jgi:hypothetical protein
MAIYYAGLNGVQASNTTPTTPYDGSSLKIEVVCTGTVPFYFARVLGFTETEVSARAVALKLMGYAIFHGGDKELIFNQDDIAIFGSVHSNGNFKANGGNISIDSVCEAVGEIMENGVNINIPNQVPNAEYIPLSKYVQIIRLDPGLVDSEEDNATEYFGDYIIDSDLNKSIYAHGKVEIEEPNISINGSIIADDDIIINKGNLEIRSPVIYSKNGKIEIKEDGTIIYGTLYSPNSEIIINNSPGDVIIYGRIVADFVRLNGSGITMDASGLPDYTTLLIE